VHTPIDDYREGACVCTTCGLVLEEQLTLPSFVPNRVRYAEVDNLSYKKETFLKDVCDRAQISNGVIYDTLAYVQKVTDHLSSVSKRFQIEEIVAYALYHTLNVHNSSRTITDIARYSGVPQSRLWAIESSIPTTASAAVENMIDGFCASLGIAYFHTSIIRKNIINNMDELEALHPGTITSAIIYIYSKKVLLNLTMKKICEVCQVSSPNVHKTVRRLNKMQSINFSFIDE
jgi:transcription initiation factor TFIIIB Brf1 subunit/transcription initiation factor TFIIB